MYLRKEIPRVVKVVALDGYRIYLEYNDEIKGTVDLSHLKNKEVFKWWDEADNFSKVHVDSSGAIAWNEDLDIDSLSCYLKIIKKTFEEYAGS